MINTKIKDCMPGMNVKIQAWIEKVRDTRYMQFVILKDRTGKIQVTVDKAQQPEIAEIFKPLIADCVVTIEGQVNANEFVKMGGKELIASSVKVESVAEVSPIDSESSIDQRIDMRWIDLRDSKKRLIFEVQTALTEGFRKYCIDNGFIEVHCPTMTGNESESGAGVFEVKYFDKKAYMIQSPQFYKQMAIAGGFEKVFIQTPIYRAENSHTKQHTTEFTGFDLEFSGVEDVEDVMHIEEELIYAGIKNVSEKYGERIKEELGVDLIVPTLPFPRITMLEAYDILNNKCDYKINEGDDFDREAEKTLCDYMEKTTGHQFFFVKEYPMSVRPFYSMRKEDNPKYSKTYDLYFKDVEITSGAQREHRADILEKQIAEKGINPDTMRKNYIDFFKYGCPPHGGFGMGLDRITMLLLDLPSLKEAMFIFRNSERLNP